MRYIGFRFVYECIRGNNACERLRRTRARHSRSRCEQHEQRVSWQRLSRWRHSLAVLTHCVLTTYTAADGHCSKENLTLSKCEFKCKDTMLKHTPLAFRHWGYFLYVEFAKIMNFSEEILIISGLVFQKGCFEEQLFWHNIPSCRPCCSGQKSHNMLMQQPQK